MAPRLPARRGLLALALLQAPLVIFQPIDAQAQQHPANPSFSGSIDDDLLLHQFGTFRQGATGATLNFSVYNLPYPTGTTASMSLVGTASLGNSSVIVLQPGTVSGLPAGGSSPMQLVLSTSQPGNLSVSYTLRFASDGMPSEPLQQLAIAAYATVYRRGDYNLDHSVNDLDYNLWRSTMGSNNAATDGNENGIVDAADYVVWRDNYTGPPVGGGAAPLGASFSAPLTTPEPSSCALVIIGAGVAHLLSPRRRIRAGARGPCALRRSP